jgi:hypothetical protein
MRPYQAAMLQYYSQTNPQMAAMLRAQFMEANRPRFDASAGDGAGNSAKQRYIAETLNPQLGAVAVKDGPNASSFASARQADLIAAGNRGSEELFQTAENADYDRALKLYQIQLQQFNQDNDDSGMYGGVQNQGQPQQSAGDVDGSIGGRIAGGVFELGKRYLDAKKQGTFNPGCFGYSAGQGVGDLIKAPAQFGSGVFRGIKGAFGG